jgi:hypothetical protein
MAKLIFSLGLITSLAIFAIAIVGAPATGDGRKNEPQKTASACTVEALPLDEGYGVSRTIIARKCPE